MLTRLKSPASLLLFAALIALFIARGVVPALSSIQSDFPNYFTAAKIVADGGDVTRLYDDAWFQTQMRFYGVGKGVGKFSPFPPPTALLLVPAARFEPLNALRLVTVLSVLGLIASVVLLARILEWSVIDAAVFVLLSGYAVLSGLRDGQPYIIVSLSCILAYYARLTGRPLLAGICFGLFIPIKYFPVVFILYFACRREWRLVLGAAVSASAVSLLSVLVLGWKVHEHYLSSVLGNHLVAKLSMQDPFTASFQSFDTLSRRLFLYDAAANPMPWFASPALQIAALIITKVSILAAAIATLMKLNRGRAPEAVAPSLGIIGIVTLLLAPATASYHFVLLWLPVGLLASHLIRRGAQEWAAAMLLMYALIGFFPYRFTMPFEGRGFLSLLAFPRLYLMLAIFAAGLYGLLRMTARSCPSHDQ
jgi:Glycosyltransferase family 87